MDGRTPTSSHDQQAGRLGEDLADAHLRRLGWTVLERNWRCPDGELDLVCRDPEPARADGRGGTLVFVEVKYRSGLGYGDPLEAVTRAKLRKLTDLAHRWLASHPDRAARIRIDAVGVLRQPGGSHRITHVRGITR